MDKLGFEIQKEIVKIDLSDTQYCVLTFSSFFLTSIVFAYFFLNVEDIRLEQEAQDNQGKNGIDIISSEEFEYNKKRASEKHLNSLFTNRAWKNHVNKRNRMPEEDSYNASEQDLFEDDGDTISSNKLEDKLAEIDRQLSLNSKENIENKRILRMR